MRVYSYNRDTGEYVGTVYADPDPMQPGEFLFAAFTTHLEPPEFQAGKRRVFNERAGAWEQHDVPPVALVAGIATPPEDRERVLRAKLTLYLDTIAIGVGSGYNSMDEAVSYAEEPAVPRYQAEGRALRAWRSRLWFAFDELLPQLESGAVDWPASDFELFDMLPRFSQQDIDDAMAALAGNGE